MIEIIMYFFPAILSLKIKERSISKKEFTIKEYIFEFIKYCLYINFIVFTVLFIYSMNNIVDLSYLLTQIRFIFKYLAVAILSAIIVPFAEEFINKNIKVNIEIEENEKTREDTKSRTKKNQKNKNK
jgi:membrane protease YdiL (CAAX protease family)